MSNSTTITDELFLIAAKILEKLVSQCDIDEGRLYPPLNNIREVSMKIAIAVAEVAYESGLTRNEMPENLEQMISKYIYDPHY